MSAENRAGASVGENGRARVENAPNAATTPQRAADSDGGVEAGLYRLIAGWTVVYATGSWVLEYAYSRLGVRHPDPVTLAVKCVIYALVWAPLLAIAVALSLRWPVRGRRDARRIALHAAATFIAPFVWGTLSYGLCLWLVPGWQPLGLVRMYRTTGYSVLYVYSVIVLICHVLADIRRRYADEMAALDVAEHAARARLEVLAMELQPHFVGNALHSVSALLSESPTRAAEALRRLRNLLAQALHADRLVQVSMREELAMLRWYTETQQLRFGDRLRIAWDVDASVLDAAVPTMLLQPLVENAIKYSVEAADRIGTITVSSAVRGGRLTVRVCDDGVGIGGPARRGQGVGLANVRERLRWLYGAEHALQLTSAVPGPGTVVDVAFPFRPVDRSGARDANKGIPLDAAPARTRDDLAKSARAFGAMRAARDAAWHGAILVRRDVWLFLFAWAFALGVSAWLLDVLVTIVSTGISATLWSGSARIVEVLLTLPALTMAVVWTADRWPVRSWSDGWRVIGQIGIAIVVGPIWGTVAYWLNPALALWNGAVGRWGMIAIEAKGVLFAYGTASVLAHAVLRARQQRTRELAGHALRAELATARVQAATLGIHTTRVTAALDTVLTRLPHDSVGANEVLVDVAAAIEGSLALSRSDTVTMREVLQLAEAHARLLDGVGIPDVFRADVSDDALRVRVPPLAVWPALARAIDDAAVRGTTAARAAGAARQRTYTVAHAHVVRQADASATLVVRIDAVANGVTRIDQELRVPVGQI